MYISCCQFYTAKPWKRTINLFNDLPEVDLDRDATAQRLNVIQLM